MTINGKQFPFPVVRFRFVIETILIKFKFKVFLPSAGRFKFAWKVFFTFLIQDTSGLVVPIYKNPALTLKGFWCDCILLIAAVHVRSITLTCSQILILPFFWM